MGKLHLAARHLGNHFTHTLMGSSVGLCNQDVESQMLLGPIMTNPY